MIKSLSRNIKIGCGLGVSNLQPTGPMRLRMAVNEAQHKTGIYLNHYEIFCVITCPEVLNVAQDNSSSSSVVQRHRKVGHPCLESSSPPVCN